MEGEGSARRISAHILSPLIHTMKSMSISSLVKQDQLGGAQKRGERGEGSEAGAEDKVVDRVKVVVEANGEGHGDGDGTPFSEMYPYHTGHPA
jgi:hypothetical protein